MGNGLRQANYIAREICNFFNGPDCGHMTDRPHSGQKGVTMKTLKVMGWLAAIGCYYVACYLGGWFLGGKLGAAVTDAIEE